MYMMREKQGVEKAACGSDMSPGAQHCASACNDICKAARNAPCRNGTFWLSWWTQTQLDVQNPHCILKARKILILRNRDSVPQSNWSLTDAEQFIFLFLSHFSVLSHISVWKSGIMQTIGSTFPFILSFGSHLGCHQENLLFPRPTEDYPTVLHSAQGWNDQRLSLVFMMFKAKLVSLHAHLDIISVWLHGTGQLLNTPSDQLQQFQRLPIITGRQNSNFWK